MFNTLRLINSTEKKHAGVLWFRKPYYRVMTWKWKINKIKKVIEKKILPYFLGKGAKKTYKKKNFKLT